MLTDKSKRETRSPIKEKPLRQAGQSVDEEIQRVFDEKVMPWVALIGCCVMAVFMEWVHWLTKLPPQPIVVTIVCLAISAYAWRRAMGMRDTVRALRQGRDGERAVGQYLDGLQAEGCRIFHDLQGDGFNIDHVVVGPTGVFTVETKTISKPVRGSPTVRLADGRILVNGRPLDRDPLAQAAAQAKTVREILESSTGRRYPVKAAVVFPGWFVEPMREDEKKGVWVLTHQALVSFIEHEPRVLADDEVAKIAHHLALHIRARERQTQNP